MPRTGSMPLLYFIRKQRSKLNLLPLLVATLLLGNCARQELAQTSSVNWKLVWADEFNKNGKPDPEKWGFASRSSPDWACYCTDTLATTFVQNGELYLRGIINRDATDSVKYKTGCIQTKGKFAFKYGKVEVRAKLGKGKGSWPAIWLMPQQNKYGFWPHSGEIDIMEQLNSDSIFYQTLHSNYIDQLKQKTNPVYFNTSPYQVGEYNVYGLEWYPDRLDFFVNGRKTFTYPKVVGTDPTQWPYDQDFYIILNQALGGKWVGEIHDQDVPVQMAVDWVRVYQQKDQLSASR
ncbi:glycoside hydrolase family 16 protein (plasmid) [Hymenobacter tibetensis]|uniref:Glycoside hydrolase family 16 protein n=1 Tax=Hymenobacter tibetensis TaxID=497967 RepID=A0ABY4D5P2_9BACT|nr:glycoside hydrolase family 16 protein [Hymenobacter tibetensis]UOG77367.1 glycoside hydrolase family 16 protein [Hymenobacter tibetensis]